MPDDQSVLERLRTIAPPAVRTPEPADRRARAALLDAAHAEQSRAGRRRPRAGWRWIAIVVGITTAAAAGVAVAQLDREEPAASNGTFCAMWVARRSSVILVPPSAAPYAAQCGRAWADWRPGERATPDQFTACQRDDGVVVVYHARTDVCARLGLAAAPEQPSAAAQRIISFMNTTGRRIAAGGCVPLADARAIVKDELNKAELRRWQTRTGTPRSEDERCATLGFDSDMRTVTLTPMRPQDVTP